MSLDVVPHAGLLKRPNPVEAVAVFKVEIVNFLMRFVRNAANLPKFLSNQAVTNPFTAAIASNPDVHTKDDETTLAGGFFYVFMGPSKKCFRNQAYFLRRFLTEKPKLPTASPKVQYWP